jgi:hypothetical protein
LNLDVCSACLLASFFLIVACWCEKRLKKMGEFISKETGPHPTTREKVDTDSTPTELPIHQGVEGLVPNFFRHAKIKRGADGGVVLRLDNAAQQERVLHTPQHHDRHRQHNTPHTP